MRKTDNHNILIIEDDPGVREAILNSIVGISPGTQAVRNAAALFDQIRPSDQPSPKTPLFKVTMAENGHKGIELTKAAIEQKKPFAAAFIDMQMPGIDGARTAKQILDLDPHIKIVIVTAFSEYSVEDIVRTVGHEELLYLRKPFNSEEIRQLARALTRQWNIEHERRALTKALAQSREQEIAVAARIQNTLLLEPSPSDLDGIQIAQLSIASKQVDGDFLEFFRINNRCVDLVIADVMGKGIPAALLGAATKNSLLRTFNNLMLLGACSSIPEPREMVATLHQTLISRLEELETFITMCYARIEMLHGTLKLVDCGHTRTIHYRHRYDRCELLEGVNMPLGFPEIRPFEQIVFDFDPGDLFFFYSDGLTEAADAHGELYGEQRLERLVKQHARKADLQSLMDAVKTEITAFSGMNTFADDFTCLAIKIN